jgi:hypothetical protein
LKFASAQFERKLKLTSRAGEILTELSLGQKQDRVARMEFRGIELYSVGGFLFPKNGDQRVGAGH